MSAHDLKFCPRCGAEALQFSGNKKWECSACNFVLYHNIAGAVAVLIRLDGRILFSKRNVAPAFGKLDLPGGFCDEKESAEETCAREIFEELNITIDPENFTYLGSRPNIYHYKDIDYNTLDLFFEVNLQVMPVLKLQQEEISALEWLIPEEINLENIAFESQKNFLKSHLHLD